MSSQWRCPSCGHLNSGLVGGLQYGGSFADLVSDALRTASKCARCGGPRERVTWKGPRGAPPLKATCCRCGTAIRDNTLDETAYPGVQCVGCGIVYCITCFSKEPLKQGRFGTKSCAECDSAFKGIDSGSAVFR